MDYALSLANPAVVVFRRHGPWTVTGLVPQDKDPSVNLSHNVIEDAIDKEGFQLWRMGKKREAKSWPFEWMFQYF